MQALAQCCRNFRHVLVVFHPNALLSFSFLRYAQAVPWYMWSIRCFSFVVIRSLWSPRQKIGLVSHAPCIQTDCKVCSCHPLAKYWRSFLIPPVLHTNLWYVIVMAIWTQSFEIPLNKFSAKHCSIIHSKTKVQVTQNINRNVNIYHSGLQTRPKTKFASISTIKMQIWIITATSAQAVKFQLHIKKKLTNQKHEKISLRLFSITMQKNIKHSNKQLKLYFNYYSGKRSIMKSAGN